MSKEYRFRFKYLDVYQLAVEHFDWTCRVVQGMPKGPFKVTDQALGASLSIAGNIGEANGRDKQPREVAQHYRYALGSTFEAATHLDALASLGVIEDEEYNAAEKRLARIAAMLRSLTTRQRRKAQGAKRPRRAVPSPAREETPATQPSPQPSTPRASGVPAGPKGPAGIDPARSAVPQGAKRPSGIDPREAGPRGSAATDGDRPSRSGRSPTERSDRRDRPSPQAKRLR